jgi:alpha-ketoglutarate-dependent 2,4-dichlorophenoxyacetate dioxygenase
MKKVALANGFGAEVTDVDLAHSDPATDAAIHQAYLDHRVLVVRDQHLSVAEQIAFSRRFGPLLLIEKKPGLHAVLDPEIDEISNVEGNGQIADPDSENQKFKAGNQLWHTDMSFRPIPATASLLYCHEAVSHGGGTEFADMVAAYDALPADRQAALDGLIAEHSLLQSRTQLGMTEDDVTDAMRERFPPAFQPLVRTHPETGRKALFLSGDAFRILGMDDAAAVALIDELIDYATQPRFTFVHQWTPGDLVIWDNRCTIHRGLAYEARNERRVMHRTTAMGDGPTVIAGEIVLA